MHMRDGFNMNYEEYEAMEAETSENLESVLIRVDGQFFTTASLSDILTKQFRRGWCARSQWRADESGLVAVLEAVRSQMCWERDRDQLTMGFQDLHTAVTEALAAYKAKVK